MSDELTLLDRWYVVEHDRLTAQAANPAPANVGATTQAEFDAAVERRDDAVIGATPTARILEWRDGPDRTGGTGPGGSAKDAAEFARAVERGDDATIAATSFETIHGWKTNP